MNTTPETFTTKEALFLPAFEGCKEDDFRRRAHPAGVATPKTTGDYEYLYRSEKLKQKNFLFKL